MIKMRKSLRSTLKIAWLTLAWALVFPLLAQASAKDGEAEVYEGKTATIYLGTPYQNTLRKSTVITYAWYSENDSYVAVTSSTQNYARIKGIRATSSCKVYFKCSYSLDGYYRTMDFYYEVKVLASSISVTRISLSHSTANLTEGNTLQLTASVYPTNATNRSVNWLSSDASVASVSSNGLVTARAAGTATITCRTADGSGCYDVCRITVEAGTQELIISDEAGLTEIPPMANIRYERLFYAGWNSVCLPFTINTDLLGLRDAQIAVVDDEDKIGSDRYVSYRLVERVEAGTACLVYVPSDQVCKIALEGVELVSKPDKEGALLGTFTESTIGSGCYKLAPDGKSFALTKSQSAVCKPFRAYIRR